MSKDTYIENLEMIKRLAIISLFSDDDLMEMIALKGGSTLSMIYQINERSSQDLDVSLQEDFEEDVPQIKEKLQELFDRTFEPEGYKVFDLNVEPTPSNLTKDRAHFWGGYRVDFKVISLDKYHDFKDNLRKLAPEALSLDSSHTKRFFIDISKYEYIPPREEVDFDGYTIYVYSPVMIIYEKLRALCQQLDRYTLTGSKPRPRDFFDIYTIIEKWPDKNRNLEQDILKPSNIDIMRNIFNIKRVPLEYLMYLKDQREFHREAFSEVESAVRGELNSFDFYFDYVIRLVNKILRVIEEMYTSEEIAATEPPGE